MATFIIIRFLHFPYKHLQNKRAERTAQRIVWVVVLVTLLPSIYFGYDMVQQNRFTKNANNFIAYEAHFTNDYLLNKKIDAKAKNITLIYGGKEITQEEIELLKAQLIKYNLQTASLEIKQGFAYLSESNNTIENEQLSQLTMALEAKEKQGKLLQLKLDSINNQQKLSTQIYAELKAQYPVLKNAILQPSYMLSDSSGSKPTFLVLLSLSAKLSIQEKSKIENWLKVRLNQQNINLIFQQ